MLPRSWGAPRHRGSHSCDMNLPEGFGYSSATNGVGGHPGTGTAVCHSTHATTASGLDSMLCNRSAKGVAADRPASCAPPLSAQVAAYVKSTTLSSPLCSALPGAQKQHALVSTTHHYTTAHLPQRAALQQHRQGSGSVQRNDAPDEPKARWHRLQGAGRHAPARMGDDKRLASLSCVGLSQEWCPAVQQSGRLSNEA